jgi:hypothetical protein
MRQLLLIAIGLFPLFSIAQEKDSSSIMTFPSPTKIRYKATSLSAPYRMIRDEGHTPLFHNGPTFQVAAYNERWRTKSITKFEMVIGLGSLKTNKKKRDVVTKAPSLIMEVNYHYMVPVKKLFKDKGDLYLGGIFTNTLDGRLYLFLPNNSFGYEFSNVINPAAHLSYNFNLGKNNRRYQTGFKLNFALLAHVIRPNYIGMEPSETYLGEKIKPLSIFTHGNRVVLPNRFIRINTELYLDRFQKSDNDKFRIFYGWGMHITKLPKSNPLYSIYHSIGVVSMIYSEKKKKNVSKALPK